MKSKHLIIYTEEESAKFFLNELLVRIRQDYRLFEWKFSVIAANGKYDQYARLKEKLSGFANKVTTSKSFSLLMHTKFTFLGISA